MVINPIGIFYVNLGVILKILKFEICDSYKEFLSKKRVTM